MATRGYALVSGQVVGVDNVTGLLFDLPRTKLVAVQRAVARAGIDLSNYVKTNKLSGQVLNVRTGRLRRSINTKTVNLPTGATASVGTNVVYGRAWELGFSTPAMTIVPTRRQALFWPGAAHPVRRVNVPARVNAPRSFLRSALAERRPVIHATIAAAVRP